VYVQWVSGTEARMHVMYRRSGEYEEENVNESSQWEKGECGWLVLWLVARSEW